MLFTNVKKKTQLLSSAQILHSSICVEETISRFGYDPRYLKPSSYKHVIKRFDCCGRLEERKFRCAQMQHMCLECSNRKNARNAAGRAKRSKLMKLRNLDPAYIHPTKGVGHTIAAREKISKARLGKRLGKANPNYGRAASHGKRTQLFARQGEVWFRSSWEKRVAIYFDSLNLSWAYEPRAFEITYEYLGVSKEGTYRPDFYIESWGIFIEVKGYWRDDAWEKFEAFRQQHKSLTIEIWDEPKLKSLGVL
jgi:hypothetical protein